MTKGGIHFRGSREGFTLLELVLVILILSLSAALVLPALASRLGNWRELRELARIVNSVNHLRDTAFSLRIPARLELSGNELTLLLDGDVRKRFTLGAQASGAAMIRLNRFGLTPGGEMVLILRRRWLLRLEPGSGEVILERSP